MVVTTTPTTVLVLNPAFLQEIKDSNPDLWHTQHQLRQICWSEDEPKQVIRHLVQVLDEFRDQLALQFALEECYGFLEIPLVATKFNVVDGDLVQRVHSEHCPLYLQISELAEEAQELQYRGIVPEQLGKLIQSIKSFDQRLQRHENLEGELIEHSLGHV